jgi:hypothetical protein
MTNVAIPPVIGNVPIAAVPEVKLEAPVAAAPEVKWKDLLLLKKRKRHLRCLNL